MINFDWRSENSNKVTARPLKRSTMLSIIALTTLSSMTVTSCAQTQSLSKAEKEKEEKKDEQNATSSTHSTHSTHYHGGHGIHMAGSSGSSAVASSSEQEFGRVKSGSHSSNTLKTSGYQAPPANAGGSVSRGWFGRFCGSVFGG